MNYPHHITNGGGRPRYNTMKHCKHCRERIKHEAQFEPAYTVYRLANRNAETHGINPHKCTKSPTGEHQP